MTSEIIIDGKKIDVKEFISSWALALMQQGVIVDITISRWRGKTSLTNEELGIKNIDEDSMLFAKKYINYGSHKLLPPEIIKELNRIEQMARNNLNYYSFSTVWGRFVPSKVFSIWEAENQRIRDLYFQAAIAFRNRYDEIVAKVKQDYKHMARDVWARLYPNNKDKPSESFIEEFTNKIISEIPPVEDIVNSFKYETNYSIILLPSLIAQDKAKADKIIRENEMEEFKASLDKEIKRRISEEYIKRKTELIDNFLQSTVYSMRKNISELCDEILKSIAKMHAVKDLNKNIIKNIMEMIKKVRLLNFYNDNEIEKLLNELETEVCKFKGERNTISIESKLKEIVEVSKKEFTPANFNPAVGYLEV